MAGPIETLTEELLKRKDLSPVVAMLLLLLGAFFVACAAAGHVAWPINASLDVVGRASCGGVALLFLAVALLLISRMKLSPDGDKPECPVHGFNHAADADVIQRFNDVDKPECSVQVFDHAADADVIQHFNDLARKGRDSEVVLMGTGLAILSHFNTLANLINLVNEGKIRRLAFVLGNPYSHPVQLRLIEEECGENAPNIGLRRLRSHIDSILEEINKTADFPDHISVRLFSNYPTFAMLKIDKNYLIYNYSYSEIGNLSPALRIDDSCGTLSTFFDRHYDRIKSSSVDAKSYFEIIDGGGKTPPTDLLGFSVYFIPDGAVYEIGSSVLGYDVRAGQRVHSGYADLVNNARSFGFHLTIADALYAANQKDVDYIEELVKAIFRKIGGITVSYEVKAGFPDDRSISLRCTDHSGTLHALHCELVSQVYTQAVGSNYTLFGALANRAYCADQERNNQMTRLYHAPYVLDCFLPHLTLLDNVPLDQMERVTNELRALFAKCDPSQTLEISKLAIMRKNNGFWDMPNQEIEL